MKKLCLALVAFFLLSGHDMFLKLDTYFLAPNTQATIKLFNGTFTESDNTIDRNRMVDVSLVGSGNRSEVDTTQWREEGGTTILDIQTGEAGTWVAGVSTRPRNIEMAAEDFNGYLEHDGVLDMLEWRKENDALGQDAVEKYSKHVKTIFQVGEKMTDDWQTVLGYPIEFVPLENPYETHAGHELSVQLLWQGAPLANQLVYIGSNHAGGEAHSHAHASGEEHSHEHEHAEGEHGSDEAHSHEHADGTTHSHAQEEAEEHDHHHAATTQARTDAEGKFSVKLSGEGIWYLRTIHLVTSEEPGLTHESNWATLTFEVGVGDHSHEEAAHHHDGHDHGHDHDHDHDHEGGIPSYAYWVLSLAVIGGLFFWFNRNA
ncbi:MAG: DUF4198 domain-containing protein [Bacteroidota bacterium]